MMAERGYSTIMVKLLWRAAYLILFLFFLIYFLIYNNRKEIKSAYKLKWQEPDLNHDLGSMGDLGKPVDLILPSKQVNEAYRNYGLNEAVSELISLNRRLYDHRDERCKAKTYPSNLPDVGVVIVFFDESWTTLLRTVHSVINRSPKKLLKEIILVDDGSNMVHLKEKLDDYISKINELLSTDCIVKIVRNKKNDGLIKARVIGADTVTADVIVFLDSHCEVNIGWLVPLLAPISENYKTVTCPIIDFIKHENLAYEPYTSVAQGYFSWDFFYKEEHYSVKSDEEFLHGIPSPVMNGGLFAIHKKWWLELGKYDPELYIWGGEQYEISFKIWMCHGNMLNVPCSRVGHIFRGPGLIRNNGEANKLHPNAANNNFRRVAEVWMDEYKYYLMDRRHEILHADIGPNIESRFEIRNRLQCHDFEWYLRNIIKDLLYTAYEPDRSHDQIKLIDSQVCMDGGGIGNDHKAILYPCSPTYIKNNNKVVQSNQNFRYTWLHQLIVDEWCLTIESDFLVQRYCKFPKAEQFFEYDEKTDKFITKDKRCVTAANELEHLTIKDCENNNSKQKWKLILNDLNKDLPWKNKMIHSPRNANFN